jgi:pimeloyl-ACP methyl ester carboxylesterase
VAANLFPRPSPLRTVVRFLLIALAHLLVAALILFFVQRQLIFHPQRIAQSALQAKMKEAFEGRAQLWPETGAIVLEPASGPSRGTALVFHGNAGLNLDRAYFEGPLGERGLRVILAEYPGYGIRDGDMGEQSFVDDAVHLYQETSRRFEGPIVLVGESLGSGVAAQLVARLGANPPAGLILITPFASMRRTADFAFSPLPLGLLVRDPFDSVVALSNYPGRCALLIARDDEVVGSAQGLELGQRIDCRAGKTLILLEDAHHNDWMGRMTAERWNTLLSGF